MVGGPTVVREDPGSNHDSHCDIQPALGTGCAPLLQPSSTQPSTFCGTVK